MDRDDRELFESSVRAAVAAADGADLDAVLADIGWRDALDWEPRVAIAALFEAQGRAGVASSALGWVLAAAVGAQPDDAVVLPALGVCDAPGLGGTVDGLGLASLPAAHDAVVVTASGTGHLARRVRIADLRVTAVAGIDGRLGLVRVTADAADGVVLGDVDWPGAVARAQLAVAHELVGASRAMLDLARDHALERIQFDRPIARFQAVRHKLADTLIAVENAAAAIDGAWRDGTGFGASIAKAVAGRSARVAARHSQQVLAGIGFTDEHVFHRYLRRVLVLDGVFGSADALTKGLGRDLIESRSLPAILPL